ncbi:MAG: hypothetical protein IJO91_00430, partial [Oscillospiraceae bacterium]|nr:hypothetical protein [Oscillospiraceae bacterium]
TQLIGFIFTLMSIMLLVSGCFRLPEGYVTNDNETQELQWLAEELQLVCDEVESVMCTERVLYSHKAGVTALVVNFQQEIDEKQAEVVIEQLLCQLNNTQLLDVLLSHGWFKNKDAVIVFYSSGRENDYIFELLRCHDFKILLGSERFWAKNKCFENHEWELSDYIDIDSYSNYFATN